MVSKVYVVDQIQNARSLKRPFYLLTATKIVTAYQDYQSGKYGDIYYKN